MKEFKQVIIDRKVRLESIEGEGKAGEVYLGILIQKLGDLPIGTRVAVKIYKPEILKEKNQQKRIEREFKVGKELNHPNLIKTYHLGYTDFRHEHRPYLIMEYINGPTLREYRKRNSLSLEEVINLFQQLCSAVIHLHLSKLCHRDIKPENIKLTDHNELKLMDYGVIRDLTHHTITGTNQFLGTIRYSAPEYLLNLNEERCDDYSVGAVLYFLIYGYEIFSHEELFSRLIVTISSEEVSFDIPKCINTKNWCVLLEISRELLEKESEYRLSLPKALEESKLLENGDLWEKKIIPLVYYRASRVWDHPNIKHLDPSYVIELFPDSIGIDNWLPPEYYDSIIRGLTDEGWIHLYCNIDLINTLRVIPNINEFISFDALGMSFAEWEQVYLESSSDKEKIILLRTLACQYMLNDFSLQNHYRLKKILRSAVTKLKSEEALVSFKKIWLWVIEAEWERYA